MLQKGDNCRHVVVSVLLWGLCAERSGALQFQLRVVRGESWGISSPHGSSCVLGATPEQRDASRPLLGVQLENFAVITSISTASPQKVLPRGTGCLFQGRFVAFGPWPLLSPYFDWSCSDKPQILGAFSSLPLNPWSRAIPPRFPVSFWWLGSLCN